MSNLNPNLAPSAAAGAAGWSEDRVEKLKTLAAEGYSASQIAKTLGRVSRSGVIGKLHRLGLNARAQPAIPGQRAPISRKAVEGKSTPARRPNQNIQLPLPQGEALPLPFPSVINYFRFSISFKKINQHLF